MLAIAFGLVAFVVAFGGVARDLDYAATIHTLRPRPRRALGGDDGAQLRRRYRPRGDGVALRRRSSAAALGNVAGFGAPLLRFFGLPGVAP